MKSTNKYRYSSIGQYFIFKMVLEVSDTVCYIKGKLEALLKRFCIITELEVQSNFLKARGEGANLSGKEKSFKVRNFSTLAG